MAGNNLDLTRDIGADLHDRLPLDHSLPAVFLSLLSELDVAESRQKESLREPKVLTLPHSRNI